MVYEINGNFNLMAAKIKDNPVQQVLALKNQAIAAIVKEFEKTSADTKRLALEALNNIPIGSPKAAEEIRAVIAKYGLKMPNLPEIAKKAEETKAAPVQTAKFDVNSLINDNEDPGKPLVDSLC